MPALVSQGVQMGLHPSERFHTPKGIRRRVTRGFAVDLLVEQWNRVG